MGMIEDKIQELKTRERDLLLELAAVQASLDIYIRGQLQETLTQPNQPSNQPGKPSLHDLRVKDAINIYLGFCRDQGRVKITLAELVRELTASKVVTARGVVLSATKYPFKTITNTLGSRENKVNWIVSKIGGRHFQKADTIELRLPQHAESE